MNSKRFLHKQYIQLMNECQPKIYLTPIPKSLSTSSLKTIPFEWAKGQSMQCTGNLFDDSDNDATVISAAMDGGPHSATTAPSLH